MKGEEENNGYLDIVKFLYEKGATTPQSLRKALCIASFEQNINIVDHLVSCCGVSVNPPPGKSLSLS